MAKTLTLLAVLVFVATSRANAQQESKIESDVVYGMFSGLALLMDVHYPPAQREAAS